MNNYKKFLLTFFSLGLVAVLFYSVVFAAGEPVVTDVTSSKTDGYYRVGESIPIQVTFSSSVVVTQSTTSLAIALNPSATAYATYTSGSGSTTLTFTYVVGSGDNTSDLDSASSTPFTTSTIALASNVATSATLTVTTTAQYSLAFNKALVIDNIAPTSTATSSLGVISEANASGTVVVTVTFSENMASTTVNPTLTFSGDIVAAGSLTFSTSTWASSTEYQATYTLTDADDSNYDVDVVVTLGQDLAGNTVTSTQTALIDLDTTAPSSLTVNPPASTYGEALNVVLVSTGSTEIRYTLDGTTPTCSTGTAYGGAIAVSSSTTLKAIACDTVSNASAVSSNVFTLQVNTGGGGGFSSSYAPAAPVAAAASAVSTNPVATPVTPADTTAVMQAQVTALLAQLQALIAQAKSLGVNVPASAESLTTGGVSGLSSGNNLTVGSRSETVRSLQNFLATQNKGTAGQALKDWGATGYFGDLTKNALAEWQASVGISPASGYFGPLTRNYLKSIGY